MTDKLFFDTDCISAFLWVKEENILFKLYPGKIILPKPVFSELSNPSIPHIKRKINELCLSGDVSTKEILEIIKRVENKKIIDLYIPPIVIKVLAKIGDFSPFPLNTKRLKKMTSNLEVSNQKIKSVLDIKKLPISAEKGIEITIKSFK